MTRLGITSQDLEGTGLGISVSSMGVLSYQRVYRQVRYEIETGYANITHSPTSQPSSQPTTHPSSPSISPSDSPTHSLSEIPTQIPTRIPTITPSLIPTDSPTELPTTDAPVVRRRRDRRLSSEMMESTMVHNSSNSDVKIVKIHNHSYYSFPKNVSSAVTFPMLFVLISVNQGVVKVTLLCLPPPSVRG